MGNSVGIFVVLDHEQVREDPDPQNADGTAVFAHQAGEPLTGKVLIEVKKRTKGDQVKLFLAGKEKIYTKHKNRRVTDVRNVIQIGADLADMRNRWVKKGNYSFPFSLDMPETLPSSMSYGDARKSACRVQYEISAGMGKAKIERFFRVASAPFQDIKVPCFIEPKTERIKSLGFLDVGTVTFGASVNDTQVGRGNEIDVAIACRNNSTVDIRSVEFKLIELVSYSSHDESFERKISLREMKHIHMPGLITTKVTRDDVLISQSSRGQNDINEQIFEALLSEHNVVKVKIPTVSCLRSKKVTGYILQLIFFQLTVGPRLLRWGYCQGFPLHQDQTHDGGFRGERISQDSHSHWEPASVSQLRARLSRCPVSRTTKASS
jgi:hypothetical protein